MTALQAVARMLGGEVSSGAISMPGPGHSKTDRSLRVFIDPTAPDGFRVKTWAGDDWRLCRDYVKARLGGASLESVERPRQTQKPSVPADPRAIELWSAAGPISGAEVYLAGRGIKATSGDALRYHPCCPFRLENGMTAFLPAMIGLFRDIDTNEPCGIHRTALKADGSGKADLPGLGNPKKMLGRAKGAAIKLCPDNEVSTGLGIAEGIETTLSVIGAGWCPVWALGSAGAIADFPVLLGVEALTIFADNDPAGIKAAKSCQSLWLEAGKECRIVRPGVAGADWADVGASA